ncbi:YAP-binding/ALF4/Glomulin [Lophiotrema nucula]|uniref:YAP-binding/ALF4/Glomulin n=1 Tax=Lophiotrema nucula TaxID=690887 RepID=A0A6A5ZT63_9PLEO|nr:YAP-binding/ALF4/Glomulin [Lophiotrema nucula]
MAEEAKEQNPLLAARPPATDYITYLTIIEYNLTEENLPVLQQILQDTELTQNIGWDLVHLLLPLLPASEECLQEIAARGNPREVILKVTEALRLLEFDEPAKDSDDEEEVEAKDSGKAPVQLGESSLSPALPSTALPPLHVLKFEILLTLLGTLHVRVKTKYPSRFLSTSLQAVLAAYNRSKHHIDELTLSAIKLVKTLSGTKRPQLPPRTPSGNLLRTVSGMSLGMASSTFPDPEAQSEPPTADETTLSDRLFQSFLTHVLEDYVLSLSSAQDVPGLAWSSRLMEKFQPERIVPNKVTYAERFGTQESLKARSAIVGQIVALAQDLGLHNQELLKTIEDPEHEKQGVPSEEDEPPSSASDIPLSKTGSLVLYTARIAKQLLFAQTTADEVTAVSIFPDHALLLENFVGVLGPQSIGLEPEALLDTLLSLGLTALEQNNIGEPADDEAFAKYLQTTSLVSANCPSPSLRYQAHYLTSTILRSHPSDVVRLTFIRDTLEHCPYENLKASAVAWLKGETMEANIPIHSHSSTAPSDHSHDDSVFSTPVALSTTSPFLFPDLTKTFTESDLPDLWIIFRTNLSFYLAVLNFYYLLLSAKVLHENLDIVNFNRESHVEETYLIPLKAGIGRFRGALEEGGELAASEGEEGIPPAKGELELLEDALARVEGGIKALEK